MLVGIGFLSLILAVAVLITIDVRRTPTEAPAGQSDRYGHDPERVIADVRRDAGVHAFPREPAVREKPAAPPMAAGARLGAGPVPTDSFDRPDEAARGFDQMRREMSQSAASEAALRGKFNAVYMNLSRRSQALVERQLRLIESLEHGEQDQQRLASLAKLNRIAMRMQRNSQNLLVLAGQESATGWNQPVTLAHLVDAALSEIEDCERVSFEVQPDIAVRGPAVYDAVHVLVELIDNATAFSAAEMPVHITGRILSSGGALVDITDRGIGMTAKEMAYANQQLDNPPAADIDVPKWMGLLVVARLAARHGIRVRLNQAELGGLTALVWFPDGILTHYSTAVDPGRAAGQGETPRQLAGVCGRADEPARSSAAARLIGLVGPSPAGHDPDRAGRGCPALQPRAARRAGRGPQRGRSARGEPGENAGPAHLRRGRVRAGRGAVTTRPARQACPASSGPAGPARLVRPGVRPSLSAGPHRPGRGTQPGGVRAARAPVARASWPAYRSGHAACLAERSAAAGRPNWAPPADEAHPGGGDESPDPRLAEVGPLIEGVRHFPEHSLEP